MHDRGEGKGAEAEMLLVTAVLYLCWLQASKYVHEYRIGRHAVLEPGLATLTYMAQKINWLMNVTA